MTPRAIKSVDDLQRYLHSAMQLEHATIPPYLTALYSIRPGTNLAASQVLRTVVVEEMLHLTIAANLLNAIGGRPDLTVPGFVPRYPTGLPDGEKDFTVSLQAFSKNAIDTFLKIERPRMAPEGQPTVRVREAAAANTPSSLGYCPVRPDMYYYSIGEFYEEIRYGFDYLFEQKDQDLFCGDEHKQITSEYYYSGGGHLEPITNISAARESIRLITDQGEGDGGGIYDHKKELAHFFRFQELYLERYYQVHDTPGNPTGPALTVDWDAVYPIKTNASLDDYKDDSELERAAIAFNDFYADFLAMLTRAYNGERKLLFDAVPRMFQIRQLINQLIHNPLPGAPGVNAAPTFQIKAKVPA